MNHAQSFYFLLFSAFWMGWNVLLAIVPICLAKLIQKAKARIVEIVLLNLWILFLPNTLYMVTDVIHAFSYRFNSMTRLFWIMGVGLYACVIALAIFTFVLSIRPVLEKYQPFLNGLRTYERTVLLSLFSLLVGFAIAMGRFQRTNTWYIVTQPMRVVRDVVDSLTDPTVLFVAVCYSIGAFVIIKIIDTSGSHCEEFAG